MTISILEEITQWNTEYSVSNGIYHVNSKGWLVAYQPPGEQLKEFTKPMKLFSKSGRKFRKIGHRQEQPATNQRTVLGSNGTEYVISDGQCSCPGFHWRGTCKHVKHHADHRV